MSDATDITVTDEQPTEATADAPADLPQRIEAALMTTDRSITPGKLGELFGGIGVKAVKQAVAELNKVYEDTARSFRIEMVAGGYQILTLPQYAQVLEAMHRARSQQKLGPAALETLAIIAYKQPILRADIEAIRGVASGEVIRGLMDRHLVKIVGRAEELGRPMLYGTTKLFLEVFGLANLDDLPKAQELKPKG
jgi:segregation and condensation protein B